MSEQWQSELEKLDGLGPPEDLQDRVGHMPIVDRRDPATHRIFVSFIALAIFAVAIGFAWLAFGPGGSTVTPGGASPSPTLGLTGSALAEALGLQEVEGLSGGNGVDVSWCNTGVGETPDGRAFCMDNALDPNDPNLTVDAWTLGRLLAGHQVTAQERAQFEQNIGISPSGIPANLPSASSLKTCAGLPITIVASKGEHEQGTAGNDVVALDPGATYSPNGGTDLICDGFGNVQSVSYPDGTTVPGTSDAVSQAIKDLGGNP